MGRRVNVIGWGCWRKRFDEYARVVGVGKRVIVMGWGWWRTGFDGYRCVVVMQGFTFRLL